MTHTTVRALARLFDGDYVDFDKPIKAGARSAMDRFQQLTIAESYADKGLHLESVEAARGVRMRTIRISDFRRASFWLPPTEVRSFG